MIRLLTRLAEVLAGRSSSALCPSRPVPAQPNLTGDRK